MTSASSIGPDHPTPFQLVLLLLPAQPTLDPGPVMLPTRGHASPPSAFGVACQIPVSSRWFAGYESNSPSYRALYAVRMHGGGKGVRPWTGRQAKTTIRMVPGQLANPIARTVVQDKAYSTVHHLLDRHLATSAARPITVCRPSLLFQTPSSTRKAPNRWGNVLDVHIP